MKITQLVISRYLLLNENRLYLAPHPDYVKWKLTLKRDVQSGLKKVENALKQTGTGLSKPTGNKLLGYGDVFYQLRVNRIENEHVNAYRVVYRINSDGEAFICGWGMKPKVHISEMHAKGEQRKKLNKKSGDWYDNVIMGATKLFNKHEEELEDGQDSVSESQTTKEMIAEYHQVQKDQKVLSDSEMKKKYPHLDFSDTDYF
jgi:hypothetical protein